MKDTLLASDVLAALDRLAGDLMAEAEQLRQLDAAIGDGDLGITICVGFEALRQGLPALAGADISTILMKSGMTFNRQAASTFGALFAAMLLAAAKAAKGADALGTAEVAAMATAAGDSVKQRGKADVGDKTLLDALVPAAAELRVAAEEGMPLPAALPRATAAAEAGVQATIPMQAKMGRAAWFAERTAGQQDPGATAIWLMFRSLEAFVRE